MTLHNSPEHTPRTSVAFYEGYIFMAYSFRHPGVLQQATRALHRNQAPNRESDVIVPEIDTPKDRRMQLTNQLGLVVLQSLRELGIPRRTLLSRDQNTRLSEHLVAVTIDATINSQRFFTAEPHLIHLELPLFHPRTVDHAHGFINHPANLRQPLPSVVLLGDYEQYI